MITNKNKSSIKKDKHSKMAISNKIAYSPYRDLSTTCFENYQKSNKSISLKDTTKFFHIPCCVQNEYINKQLTFQPSINQLPVNLYPSQEKYQISRQQQYERLLEDSRRKIRERLSAKLQKQNKFQDQCTFKPNITNSFRILNQSNIANKSDFSLDTKIDIFSRLHRQADDKQTKLQILEQKHKQQITSQSQKPNHKSSYSKILNKQKHNLDPLYTRIMQVVEQRLKHRKDLEKQLNQSSTFAPNLNQVTNKIIDQKIQKQEYKKNVVERLLDQHHRKKERMELLRQKYNQKQKQNLIFKPTINEFFSTSDGQEFIKRLKNASNKCCHDDELYTFHPKINQLSNLISKHVRGKKQTFQNKINRLVYEPIQKKVKKIAKVQMDIYRQCVFNPEINQISLALGTARPHAHHCEQPVEQSFSFKPKINQNSRFMRSKSVQLIKKEKKKQLIRQKNLKEYQQLKQCTFQPRINNFRHHGLNSVKEVQGVDNYIQRTIKLNQRRQQQKIYEEKIFNLEKKYDQRQQRRYV